MPLHRRFCSVLTMKKEQQLLYFQCLMNSLPNCHFELCKAITLYLKKVSSFSHVNKMSITNLGIILGPLLWRGDESSDDVSQNMLKYSQCIVKIGSFILTHSDEVFNSA